MTETMEERIKDLETELSDAKQSVASNEGKVEMAKEGLEELGLDSVKEAKAEMVNMEQQKQDSDKVIKKNFDQLEEDYTW